jgi:hypothetical protein
VGAIFISSLAQSKLPTPTIPPENAIDLLALTIGPITYFIVLSSILGSFPFPFFSIPFHSILPWNRKIDSINEQ